MNGRVLGVDGGGTRTRLVLMDFGEGARGGQEVARSIGPSSLVHPLRPQDAAMTVCRMVQGLLHDLDADAPANPESPPIRALWAGLAGAGREPVRALVEEALGVALEGAVEQVSVGTDAEAAYHDAFGAQPGILLISGTGSGALARPQVGEAFHVGGWGPLLGDEGSGYWIGLAALKAVVAAHDQRGPDTALLGLVPHLGLDAVDGLVDWIAAADKSSIGALAAKVANRAEEGDQVAAEILNGATAALVEHAITARNRGAPPTVALVGGLVGQGGSLTSRLRPALVRAGFTVRQRPVRPEVGAARLAWETLVGRSGTVGMPS